MKTAHFGLTLVLAIVMALPVLADSHPEQVTPEEYNRRLSALIQDLAVASTAPNYPIDTKLEGSSAFAIKPLEFEMLADALRSKSLSHEEVYVSFINKTHESQTISWIDWHGRRVAYKQELKPGQTFRHRSFPGHLWLIESLSGQDTGLFQIVEAIETHIEQEGFRYEKISPGSAGQNLKSTNKGNVRVDVVLINNTSEVQTVSWINYAGKRVLLDTVQPGAKSYRETYAGHIFLVENATSGKDTTVLKMRKH